MTVKGHTRSWPGPKDGVQARGSYWPAGITYFQDRRWLWEPGAIKPHHTRPSDMVGVDEVLPKKLYRCRFEGGQGGVEAGEV